MDHSKIIFNALIAFAVLFNACKRSIEVSVPDTDLVGEIRSIDNRALSGVVVGIFDNLNDYNLAKENKDFSNAIALDTSDSKGEVKFAKLDATKRYFFYGFFEDRTLVPGQAILWDNSNLSFNIERALTRGAVTYIRVTLQPEEGFISFWTNSNTDKLPISLRLDNDSIGRISMASQSQPFAFSQGGSVVSVK
ncbi:MAG: hypothetical protein SNJ77_02075, partial [Cytophagales bacterium]